MPSAATEHHCNRSDQPASASADRDRPALHRESAGGQGSVRGLEVALVLGEKLRKLADRGISDGEQVQLTTRGLAQDIALKPARPGCPCQAVIAQAVVIETDGLIAMASEALKRSCRCWWTTTCLESAA